MKEKLIIILLLIFNILGCSSENDLIKKYWISSSWVQKKDTNQYEKIMEKYRGDDKAFIEHLNSLYEVTIEDKLIYEFGEDSLTVIHFNETQYFGFLKNKLKYEYRGDSIYAEKKGEGVASLSVDKLTKKELVLSYNTGESFLNENIMTFQPLQTFNQKNNTNYLENLLIDNEFMVDIDDTIIMFKDTQEKHLSKTIIPSNPENILDLKFGDNWYITDVAYEAFLVLGKHVIQIIEIKDEKISGLIYGTENIELSLNKMVKN